MFLQMKRFVVKEGYGQHMIERFQSQSLITEQPGFLKRTILEKKVRRGEEEIILLIQWESEEAWKNWEKSPAHIQGHRERAGKPKPDFILESSNGVYYDRS